MAAWYSENAPQIHISSEMIRAFLYFHRYLFILPRSFKFSPFNRLTFLDHSFSISIVYIHNRITQKSNLLVRSFNLSTINVCAVTRISKKRSFSPMRTIVRIIFPPCYRSSIDRNGSLYDVGPSLKLIIPLSIRQMVASVSTKVIPRMTGSGVA